jgi:hypothetical protein
MLLLVGAMTSVLLTWTLLFAVFVGMGLLVRRAFGLRPRGPAHCLDSFWIGWVAFLLVLQPWHLWMRIDWRPLAFAMALGAIGLCWNARDLGRMITRPTRLRMVFASVLCLGAVGLANRAVGPVLTFDTGVYHLGAVRWATSYAAVPGLGNLQVQLANNSSHFLYAAALEVGPWWGRSQHLANGLLLLALWAQISLSCAAVIGKLERSNPCDVFWLLLLPYVVDQMLGRNVSDLSPDLATFALGLAVTGTLLSLLYRRDDGPEEREYRLFCAFSLAAAGLVVKLSFAVFGLASGATALLIWWCRKPVGEFSRSVRVFGWATAALVGILVPWMTRSVVLSGYVAYPNSVGFFSVDWRMPPEVLLRARTTIRAFARFPGFWGDEEASQVLANWDWFVPWLVRMLQEHRHRLVVPMLLALGAAAWSTLLRRRRSALRQNHARDGRGFPDLLVLLPAMLALIFWFLVAPDPRFAGASFAILAPIIVALTFARSAAGERRRILHVGAGVAIAISLAWLVLGWSWIPPGGDFGFHPLPTPQVEPFRTSSGLTVNVPRSRGDRCWNATLPCSSRLYQNIALRHPGDLSYGFRLDARNPGALIRQWKVRGQGIRRPFRSHPRDPG